MEYVLHIVIMLCIYSSLAVSLNLLVGQSGIMCLSHAAAFGVGAYTVALLTTSVMPFFPALVLAGLLCFGIVMVFGYVATMLKEDGLVVVTFALQMVVFSVMTNWISLTRGVLGISGIPRPAIAGMILDTHVDILLLVMVTFGATLCISGLLLKSPFGRVLRTIREDRSYADSVGKPTKLCMSLVLAIAAAMAGVAGGVYAVYFSFIDPSSFSLMESVLILTMVILGGAGSLWGPVLGAIALVTFQEVLRFLGIPSAVAANIRQILYGLALVGCMLWRPQGFMGAFDFGKEAKTK